MRFLSVIFKRVLYSFVLLIAVIVLNFFLIHLAPGDPAETIAGEMGATTEEILAQIRHTYGLDKSLSEQLFLYIKKMAHGDLGDSFFFNRPVSQLVMQRVPATILLVMSALFFALSIGTFLGVVCSRKPYGFLSNFITVFALIGWSMPVFWLGIIILILLASVLPWFPVSGMYDVMKLEYGFFARALDNLHHLILPMFTLAFIYLAQYSLLARATMMEVLGSDYIRTARAKGMNDRIVIYKHALRNAVSPVITMAGLQMAYLFSGAILVETVFNWPGLGRLAFESILRRDHPTILGILFFSTLMVIVANLLTDLAHRLIDPRIRLEAK